MQVMETLLADLGRPVVRRFYELALAASDVIALCALDDNQRVVGWVMGCQDPGALHTQLKKPLHWFALRMLAVLFTRPRVVIQLLLSLITFRSINSALGDGIELTYIGVSPSVQGKGVGKALLESFLATVRQRKIQKVLLTVETDNTSALNLYQRAGFVVINSYQEGEYHRHRLELTLDPSTDGSPLDKR
jgi:ribosomal protein S18 acetylase RimI-like enzyme